MSGLHIYVQTGTPKHEHVYTQSFLNIYLLNTDLQPEIRRGILYTGSQKFITLQKTDTLPPVTDEHMARAKQSDFPSR